MHTAVDYTLWLLIGSNNNNVTQCVFNIRLPTALVRAISISYKNSVIYEFCKTGYHRKLGSSLVDICKSGPRDTGRFLKYNNVFYHYF